MIVLKNDYKWDQLYHTVAAKFYYIANAKTSKVLGWYIPNQIPDVAS